MGRVRWSGATAAATLPAALAGAALVAAPFAGTTTTELAKSSPRADARPVHAQATHARTPIGIPLHVPTGSLLTLVGAELTMVGVGAGVIVVARRRHQSAGS